MTTPKSAIEKGKLLENYIADQLITKGLDSKAYRSHGSGSGTREKADIWTSVSVFGRNLGIEAKNHKTLCMPLWWKQTKKLEELGREPVLAYKEHGDSLGDTKVVIYLNTFLDMLVAMQDKDDVESNIVETNHYQKTDTLNKLIYAKQQLSTAINKYKKEILKEE